MTLNAQPPLVIKKGVCFAMYAYDVGLAIDLEKCRKRMSSISSDVNMRHNRHAPKYFDYRPAPLMITRAATPPAIGQFKVVPEVNLLLYDFGGISVSYNIPFEGSLEILQEISCALSEKNNALVNDSRRRVEELLETVKNAVGRLHITDLIEDYMVFEIDEYETSSRPDEFHARYPQELAQILRAEKARLSEQEVSDALSCRISYGREDVTFIDWNGALIFDREAEDVRAVLEFANIELLEMRYLDHQLDDSLDHAYAAISSRTRLSRLIPSSEGSIERRVSQMQVDGAILFERVSNAPKLLGDQYLARVYRLAAQRFHLAEWSTTTLRKLDAIETIYNQMHDRASSWRLELLEWIIVILIAIEIVIPFLHK
jgi:hypothetical protein